MFLGIREDGHRDGGEVALAAIDTLAPVVPDCAVCGVRRAGRVRGVRRAECAVGCALCGLRESGVRAEREQLSGRLRLNSEFDFLLYPD